MSVPQERKIFIIYNDSIKVGHLYVIPNGEFVDIPVAISEAYRGCGFAEKAILCGLEYCREKGFHKMIGHIREDNIASIKTYEKCGSYLTGNYIYKKVSTVKNGEVVVKKVKMNEIAIDLQG